MTAIPKPEPCRATKERKARKEAAVKRAMRAACVERDGYCRFSKAICSIWPRVFIDRQGCCGPSEWAHILGRKRSRTRGQAPELRHDTAHTAQLCRRHHALEESGQLRIEALSDRGADGPLRFTLDGVTVEERGETGSTK